MLSKEDHQLYKAYYHTNTKYYIMLLEKYQAGNKYSFNIKAFFISVFYMSYRKMYRWIFILFVVNMLTGLLEEAIYVQFLVPYDTQVSLSYIISILWAVFLGGIVNKLYIEDSIKNIQKIKRNTDDFDKQLVLAAKKGGVNWAVPFLLLLFFLFIIAYMNS